ncbi:hypothetical protein BH23GEM3_BH23GEM3_20200 [soil metagenome]
MKTCQYARSVRGGWTGAANGEASAPGCAGAESVVGVVAAGAAPASDETGVSGPCALAAPV